MLAGLAALIAFVFSLMALLCDLITKDNDEKLTHEDYD